MSMRHTMKARRALTAAAITTGLALAVAGCGGDSGGGNQSSKPTAAPTENKKPDAKATGNSVKPPSEETVLAQVKGGNNVTMTINTAIRDAGGFVTISGNVQNGGQVWNPTDWRGNEEELINNSASMAGAALVDKVAKKKYLVLRDTEGRCLCTKFTGGFNPSEQKTFYVQFPAPPNTSNKVDFQIGDMPPASIEISEG